VSTSFRGWDGREHPVAANTLHSVLTALGDRTGTTEDLHSALSDAELEPWQRLLPPSVVSREGREIHVAVFVPHGTRVSVWAVTEDGARVDAEQREDWEQPRDVYGVLKGRATFVLPDDLPLGWHTLHAEAAAEAAECALVVTPERLETSRGLATDRHWGLSAQRDSVR
jgi:4-alpha-glucanotransferase